MTRRGYIEIDPKAAQQRHACACQQSRIARKLQMAGSNHRVCDRYGHAAGEMVIVESGGCRRAFCSCACLRRWNCRKDGSYILYNFTGGFSWYLYGPDNRLQHDIAGTLGNGSWGYIVGTYDKDTGPDNQRLYLNGIRVAQMSDTLPIDLNSAALGIGRHVSGIADPFNGYIDEFRIAHVQRSDGWIETTWNNMSDPGSFAVAGAEEQEGGEPPPLAGAGVVVCFMG